MEHERRRTIRIEWNSPAVLCDETGAQPRPCVVVNLSNEGARIGGINPAEVPEFCMLRVSPRSRLRPCRVMWRSKQAVGLSFAGAPAAAERVPALPPEAARVPL